MNLKSIATILLGLALSACTSEKHAHTSAQGDVFDQVVAQDPNTKYYMLTYRVSGDKWPTRSWCVTHVTTERSGAHFFIKYEQNGSHTGIASVDSLTTEPDPTDYDGQPCGDLPPVFVHEIVRQSFSISTPAAVVGAVGKWETHGFAFSKLAVFWRASFP